MKLEEWEGYYENLKITRDKFATTVPTISRPHLDIEIMRCENHIKRIKADRKRTEFQTLDKRKKNLTPKEQIKRLVRRSEHRHQKGCHQH